MRAKNSVGLSIDSSDYSIITTTIPTAPSTFNTDARSTSSITLSWTEPDDGGESITDYALDWNQGS